MYSKNKPELPCFNRSVIEETSQIFQPVTAVPVSTTQNLPEDSEAVIEELGASKTIPEDSKRGDRIEGERVSQNVVMMETGHRANHGEPQSGQFLPVEGGYILVDENAAIGTKVL